MKVTYDIVLHVTVTSTDPNAGIDSPEYEQNLTSEGERLLSGHNSQTSESWRLLCLIVLGL